MMTSTIGMTYPIETIAIINTIQRLQRSVHLGVGAASSSTSAIGNSVCPFGAFHIKWKTIYTTITTETINNTTPTARIIKYGFQETTCSLPKQSVELYIICDPNKLTICIAPDMKNITTVHKIICQIANLFIFGVMIRLDKCGTSQ